MAARGPVGVMGGTFDPIHYAHLRLAEALADTLGLAEVRFVPVGRPAHRATPATPAGHRLEMVRRAVADNPRFVADARETERAGTAYTVDTLAELRAELGPATPLWLLLGADAFSGLAGWSRWRELFGLAHIAVASRPGSDHGPHSLPEPLKAEVAGRLVPSAAPAGSVRFLPMTRLGIAATDLRAAHARGESIRYLLPDTVLDYIHQHALYPAA